MAERNGTNIQIRWKRGGTTPLGVAVVSFRSVSTLGCKRVCNGSEVTSDWFPQNLRHITSVMIRKVLDLAKAYCFLVYSVVNRCIGSFTQPNPKVALGSNIATELCQRRGAYRLGKKTFPGSGHERKLL